MSRTMIVNILDFQGMFLIGLGAFWLEDTSGLLLIYSRVTMILGGMLIPLELFPESWQPVLRVLPFSSMVYGPARLKGNAIKSFDLRAGASLIIAAKRSMSAMTQVSGVR